MQYPDDYDTTIDINKKSVQVPNPFDDNEPLYSVKVGDHVCNVNRRLEDTLLLDTFDDIMIVHDGDSSYPYLNITNINDGSIKRVELEKDCLNKLCVSGSKHMTDQEYFIAFTEIKSKYLDTLISNIYKFGFERPSPVQKLSITEAILGRDMLVQFKAGEGKTMSFCIGSLWHFDPADTSLQHVFITSSHEVARQIKDNVSRLVGDNVKVCLCIGNRQEGRQLGGYKTIRTSSMTRTNNSYMNDKEEARNAQIIVCTMGKFYDYFVKKIINLNRLKVICVDEFDNIIVSKYRKNAHNTQDQMSEVMRVIPEDAQRIFFSATVTEQSYQKTLEYFRTDGSANRFIVMPSYDNYTLENIRQYYVPCRCKDEKKDVLINLLNDLRIYQTIIFTNTIETAMEIKDFLDDREIPFASEMFHGNMSAEERKDIYNKFCKSAVRILISTDICSRGLDVTGINYVFNFDMPRDIETYIHRIGRSGRYGKKGIAISLLYYTNKNENEMGNVRKINEYSKSKMVVLPEDLNELMK